MHTLDDVTITNLRLKHACTVPIPYYTAEGIMQYTVELTHMDKLYNMTFTDLTNHFTGIKLLWNGVGFEKIKAKY